MKVRKITICIGTLKRDPFLKRLLDTLIDIELDADILANTDILVVNNYPNPATKDICLAAAKRLPIPLRYVEEPNLGLVNSRNRVVKEALSNNVDAVALLDDDDVPDRDWLRHLVARQHQSGAEIVAGNRRYLEPPPWNKGEAKRRDQKSAEKKIGKGRIPRGIGTGNVLITRSILAKLAESGAVFRSMFTHSGGEDKDFFLRAANTGASIEFAEKSYINIYYVRERHSLRGVFRHGCKAGCSKMNIAHNHDTRTKSLSMVLKSLAEMLVSLLLMPVALVIPRRRLSHVYRFGKAFGVLYFFVTGRSIKYY